MSDDALLRKFHDLTDGVIGYERSEAIIDAVRGLSDTSADHNVLYESILHAPPRSNSGSASERQ